ncbi:unnamed protein product [Spirodela intermedia]|uniref:Uncharacterized protein n=1 Tax=Spirodela intermedia TaxID=51605 RepID=A0A7I8LGB8_SPIIN|nr:unnamed protein product [Spirodela intermedia]
MAAPPATPAGSPRQSARPGARHRAAGIPQGHRRATRPLGRCPPCPLLRADSSG